MQEKEIKKSSADGFYHEITVVVLDQNNYVALDNRSKD